MNKFISALFITAIFATSQISASESSRENISLATEYIEKNNLPMLQSLIETGLVRANDISISDARPLLDIAEQWAKHWNNKDIVNYLKGQLRRGAPTAAAPTSEVHTVGSEAPTSCEATKSEWKFPQPIGSYMQYLYEILPGYGKTVIANVIAPATKTRPEEWKHVTSGGYSFFTFNLKHSFSKAESPCVNMLRATTEVDDITKTCKDLYKIHLSVKPEYLKWAVETVAQTLIQSEEFKGYVFKIYTKDNRIKETSDTTRTFASIVIYIPEDEFSAKQTQKLYNLLYPKFKNCDEIAGAPLLHNCGGPVLWVAGGHADYKPGGGNYDRPELLDLYQEANSENYAYIKGQTPIKVHSGVCHEITG